MKYENASHKYYNMKMPSKSHTHSLCLSKQLSYLASEHVETCFMLSYIAS
uniref:Uncharacterized protein n=1 Tax=Anguilla anguilla TaxID=7936 RepID=A0A0E9TYR6_ANGAN